MQEEDVAGREKQLKEEGEGGEIRNLKWGKKRKWKKGQKMEIGRKSSKHTYQIELRNSKPQVPLDLFP